MKTLKIQGQTVKVSDQDFNYLSGFCWGINRGGWVFTHSKGRLHWMCDIVAKSVGGPFSECTRYIDDDPLNNQRENMRIP